MTQQTLAQLVRAKHPGAYDDLSDEQLETAVRAKFPGVYDDVPSTKPKAVEPRVPGLATIGEHVTTKQLAAHGPSAMQPTAEGLRSAATPEVLPAVGATIGGTLGLTGGPPGAIGGATLGGAFGESARQLTNRALGRPAPATPADAATDIAIEGGIQGGMEGISHGVTRGASAIGTAVYRGYLKPSLSKVNLAKAREIVATGIREALPITKAGEAQAARLISQINAQVELALKQSKDKIDLHAVANRVRSFAQRVYNRTGAPPGDFQAAMKVADEIDAHPSLGLPEGARPTRVDVSLTEANRTKQSLDRAVGETGFGVERSAATEARKVGRHAAREAIEKQVPAVGPLNKREAQLIDALDAIAHAAGREENRSALFGVPTLVASTVGGAAYAGTNDSTTALLGTLVARGLLTPGVASRTAILAAKLGGGPRPAHITANALRIALVMALRQPTEQDK